MSIVEGTGTETAPLPDPIRLRYGDLTLSISPNGQVYVNETLAEFRPTERKLFLHMAKQRGQLQSKAGLNRFLDQDRKHPTHIKGIDTHMHNIRMRLAACDPTAKEIISTRYRKGYVFALEDGTEPRSVATRTEFIHEGVRIVINELDEVSVGGQRIKITPDEAQLLKTLILKPGIIHTRKMLMDARYGEGTSIHPKIIDVHACRIRKALGTFFRGQSPLRTVWGRGHYFGELTLDPGANPEARFDMKQKVPGPAGLKISAEDLPSDAEDVRWVMSRKATILALVEKGAVPLSYVLAKYPGLSAAEFAEWKALSNIHGLRALRTTRTGDYALSVPM